MQDGWTLWEESKNSPLRPPSIHTSLPYPKLPFQLQQLSGSMLGMRRYADLRLWKGASHEEGRALQPRTPHLGAKTLGHSFRTMHAAHRLLRPFLLRVPHQADRISVSAT